jgi:hypothetical protein
MGKMYSNTMMVVLNSRIVISHDESASNTFVFSVTSNPEINQRSSFAPSHGGILVTRKQWIAPFDSYNINGQAK